MLTLSEGALTFASASVGSASAAQPLTLANTGTVPVRVLGLLTSPDFTVSGTCGTVPVGGSCTLSVAFTPQTSGMRSGALAIQTDASTSLDFVSLLGTGDAGTVSLQPSSLSFGSVLVGKSSTPQTATLSNTGSTALTIATIGISGDFALSAASAGGAVCAGGASLPAGASCVLPVVFAPVQVGTRNGVLTVATSATPVPLSVALSGVGVQPQLAATPSVLSFGDVLLGKNAQLSLTLANTSATAVNALQFATTGDFTVSSTCGPVSLAAGSSCSITLTFTPTALGARTGSLTVVSSDPASPLTVPLSGNGLQAGSFTLTVNGSAAGSATVRFGVSATYALAVTPINGFTGAVALTCTPAAVVAYTSCSIAPGIVTLANGTQNSTVTITTVTAIAGTALPLRFGKTALVLCCLPGFMLLLRRRTPHGRVLAAALLLLATLCPTGCGSGTGDTRLRYAAPGTYQFTVSASSTTGVPVMQSVPLSLTVTQ